MSPHLAAETRSLGFIRESSKEEPVKVDRAFDMAKEEEIAKDTVSNSSTARIFIGGLSPTVTALDMEKTFSSLGKVQNIEIVHSDGRNFAFMDFEPKSDKDMAKLFAIYNGCAWKGGKLRLEKAKEHYLTRLKQEWAEDANISELLDIDVGKSSYHSDKSEKLNQDNAKLQIFFPKLRKVKAVSFKGTGKHKYSFQRVEVPSLPIHFCDCEEHCGPSEMANETYISALNSAAYEKERSIMTSVMNKLLQKEQNEVPESGTRSLSMEAVAIGTSDDNIQLKQTDEAQEDDEGNLDTNIGTSDDNIQLKQTAQEDDDDNLVTNIGVGESDDMLMQLIGKKMQSTNQVQESSTSRFKPSTDGLPPNKAHPRKRKKTTSTAPPELASIEEASVTVTSTEDEFSSILTRSKNFKDAKEREILTEDSPNENQTEHATTTVTSSTTNTWMQKSSWRDLVRESGNITFSISNIIPGTSAAAPKLPNAKESATNSFAVLKKRRQTEGESSNDVKVKKDVFEKTVTPTLISESGTASSDKTLTNNDADNQKSHKEQKRSIPNISIGEVCTFMRSAESEKQWSKAKTVLSGYLKKNSKDNNASNETKAKPPRR
ncbi:hypothetical protein Cni_G17282 [Canna indica]|uniref:RRM domain-containing protein n=1 Tax=Canna indica TaxID=4628 RepID=A0AAQ3KGN2_9LILI|nr:hypothetical protein Cni_G17282 [Canna indica]